MSKGVTQVLSQCESEAQYGTWDRNCDDWLGPGLQKLTLSVQENSLPLHLFEKLPTMPRLHYLNLDAEDAEDFHQYDFSQKFPSLETLIWNTHVSEGPSFLERLTKLTRFKFRISESGLTWDYPHRNRGVIGALPKDCKVIVSFFDWPLPLPAGLINQVTHFTFLMGEQEGCWPPRACRGWEMGHGFWQSCLASVLAGHQPDFYQA